MKNTIIAVSLITILFSTTAAWANLLPSGAFEKGLNGTPDGWHKRGAKSAVKYALDTHVYHAGHQSLRMTFAPNKKHDEGYVFWQQKLPDQPRPFQIGGKYRISVWVKAAGFHGRVILQASARVPDQKNHKNQASTVLDGQLNWRKLTLKIVIPKGTNQITLLTNTLGRGGKVWWDNLSVKWIGGDPATKPAPFRLTFLSDRQVFYRMEKNAHVKIALKNRTGKALANAAVKVSLDGFAPKNYAPGALADGQSKAFLYPITTELKAGDYPLNIEVFNKQKRVVALTRTITIVDRLAPHMPVLLWGFPKTSGLKLVKKLGFTGTRTVRPSARKLIATDGKVFNTAQTYQRNTRRLNRAMELGLTQDVSITPGRRWASIKKTKLKTGRNGKPNKKNVDGLYLKVQQFCYNVGASFSQAYANFPQLKWALIHTEVRDASQPSFNSIDKLSYKKYSGHSIPPQVVDKRGVSYKTLKNFPSDRVIADDNPILTYYRWYWKTGDGWNILNKKVVEGIKSGPRSDIKTYSDPAVRVASVYGSSASTDYIGQWTYAYPNPLKISLATDELLCMAGGPKAAAHDQKVTGGPQMIWYRKPVAPKKDHVKNPPAWAQKYPDARFITIPPDPLSEAVWSNLARPISAMYLFGWSSLVPANLHSQFKYTNPHTRHTLSHLLNDVVKPLGPALLKIPAQPSNVAYLESFASQMFAGRGTYGWTNGWGADAYLVLLYAQLQPHVVYAQTIRNGGLKNCKVLVLANCDVLTQSVVDKIHAFQNRGGVVVADQRLSPAIAPDILISSYQRTGRAGVDKAALLKRAKSLQKQLAPYYHKKVESSNPQVITRLRSFGSAKYIFVINDHRTYGNYIGQYGKVMEKGLPARATIKVGHRNNKKAYLYKLPQGGLIHSQQIADSLQFHIQLNGGQGKLFMVTPQKISKVHITGPQQAQAGKPITFQVQVVDDQGQPIAAVLPLKVHVTNSKGKTAEYSGYYGARNGQLALTLNIPINAAKGTWHITVTDLASKNTAQQAWKVK